MLWVLFLTFYLNCFLRCFSSTYHLFLNQTVDSSQLTIVFTVDEFWFVFIPLKLCQRRGDNLTALLALVIGREARACRLHVIPGEWRDSQPSISAQGWRVSVVNWKEPCRERLRSQFRALPNMHFYICSLFTEHPLWARPWSRLWKNNRTKVLFSCSWYSRCWCGEAWRGIGEREWLGSDQEIFW